MKAHSKLVLFFIILIAFLSSFLVKKSLYVFGFDDILVNVNKLTDTTQDEENDTGEKEQENNEVEEEVFEAFYASYGINNALLEPLNLFTQRYPESFYQSIICDFSTPPPQG